MFQILGRQLRLELCKVCLGHEGCHGIGTAFIRQPDGGEFVIDQGRKGKVAVHEGDSLAAAVDEREAAILGVFFFKLIGPCAFEVNGVGKHHAGHLIEHTLWNELFDFVIGLSSHPQVYQGARILGFVEVHQFQPGIVIG